MFSYRHAYHAGNHADVLKHMTVVACLNHMGQKDTGFTVVDTHAGIGTYRLDQEQARTSGESLNGIVKLAAALNGKKDLPALLQAYLDLVRSYNSGQQIKHYPGSPWVANSLLRTQDKLKLFEVHPTDARLLERHVAGLGKGRQVEVLRKNSFESLKSFLPPVSRRALVLMDPSYEIKTDYFAVAATIQDALKRFSTGTYAIWYPVIARPEAHSLARKLKTMSNTAGRPWVQVELNVGSTPSSEPINPRATQLRASGMHIINPPFTLAAALRESLPVVMQALREKSGASWDVTHGG